MILTTIPGVEGKQITKYCGAVTGEAILGANIFRDLFANVRDIIGGRSASYEKELKKAGEITSARLRKPPATWARTPSSALISTTRSSASRAGC